MKNEIAVDITIRDNVTGNYYRIPVLPETVSYSDGDAIKDTIKILDLGNVDFHSGVELDSMGWSRFFPARYDAAYCQTPDMLTPVQYRNLFSNWKDQATSLQLICPAAGLNKNMTLNSFKWALVGFEGDIEYTVEFRERKVVRPVQVTLAEKIPQKPVQTIKNREPVPQVIKPTEYTTVPGDTLVVISKKTGVYWRDIYMKNKDTYPAYTPVSVLPGGLTYKL